MIITFFNDKRGCGKSTLTLHMAKTLATMFRESSQNTRRVFIFDTVTSVRNSLALKQSQEQEENEEPENQNLWVKYINNYQEFEIKQVELAIQPTDIIFFDLQDFGEKQFDFIINSDYIIIISDSPNELESVDRDMYHLVQKMKNNSYQNSISIKKIFLTQNRVNFSERIVADFEDIDYIIGLENLNENSQIEQISIRGNGNTPASIQKFVLEVWKKINNYEEQLLV